MELLNNFLANFVEVSLEAAPWLLFGLLAAGLIKVWIPESFMKRVLGGKGAWPVIKGAFIGAPLPLCSCGVLPAAIGLRRSGASNGATLSFLVATPETGVDSIGVFLRFTRAFYDCCTCHCGRCQCHNYRHVGGYGAGKGKTNYFDRSGSELLQQ